MFVSLVLPPFLVHHMTPAEYGAWVLILQLSAYVNLLDFGLQTAIGKYVAEYDASGDREASHHLVSTSFTILAVAASDCVRGARRDGLERASAFSRRCRRGWWATCGSRSLPSDYPLPSRFRSVLFFPPSPVCSDMYSPPSSPQSAAWEPLLSSSSSAYAWQPGPNGAGDGRVQCGNSGNPVPWLAKVCEGTGCFFIPVVPPPIRGPAGKVRQRSLHLDTGNVVYQRPGSRDRRPLPLWGYSASTPLPAAPPISCWQLFPASLARWFLPYPPCNRAQRPGRIGDLCIKTTRYCVLLLLLLGLPLFFGAYPLLSLCGWKAIRPPECSLSGGAGSRQHGSSNRLSLHPGGGGYGKTTSRHHRRHHGGMRQCSAEYLAGAEGSERSASPSAPWAAHSSASACICW